MGQFEANERLRAAREEEGDSDDDADTLEARRLEAGAYTQQRLAVVMVVIAAHSRAVARRVDEKLHQVCVAASIAVVAALCGSRAVSSACCELLTFLNAMHSV